MSWNIFSRAYVASVGMCNPRILLYKGMAESTAQEALLLLGMCSFKLPAVC